MQNRILMVLLFIPSLAWSQRDQLSLISDDRTQNYLTLFLRADQSRGVSPNTITSFIDRLEKKRPAFKTDRDFLRYIFDRGHRKFLRPYTDYCNFNSMVENGTYNCLTGTALYALVLDHFNLEFKIVETNYHIFLMIGTAHGNVMFEATDPLNGFVDSPREIAARIQRYREIQPVVAHKSCYRYNFNFCNAVTVEQLVGLMYYNLSVNAYNNKSLPASIDYLEQAIKRYNTQRTDELLHVIFLTVSEGMPNGVERETCLQRVQALQKTTLAFASNAGS